MNSRSLSLLHYRLSFFILFCLLYMGAILVQPVHAEGAVCAVVKIEINQELTLERQAFDANMKISNELDLLPLNDVTIKEIDGVRLDWKLPKHKISIESDPIDPNVTGKLRIFGPNFRVGPTQQSD